MTADSLKIRRIYRAGIERLFDAWTDPRLMSRWFFVGAQWTSDVENDLRVGGTYRVRMHTDQGETLMCHGTYRELVRPHRLAFTWNSHLHEGSLVTITLRHLAEGTELTLIHSGLPNDTLRAAHGQGWDGCLSNLELAIARDFAAAE
jgi:uncharacterized protein YndB with AHSA1/START domain